MVWLGGLLFFAGIPLSVWRGLRGDRKEGEKNAYLAGENEGIRRAAYLALPLWLVVMLLPMVLSAESLPYYQRAIGTLPAVYIFPAITLDALIDWFNGATKQRFQWLVTIALSS